MHLAHFVVSLATGFMLGSILFVLRSCVDRRKGAVSEVVAVSLPILAGAVFVFFHAGFATISVFSYRLAPLIQFVFLALPVLVIARLVERLRSGESPQLADLFRITTVASLACFASSSLTLAYHMFPRSSVATIWMSVVATSLMFLAGDWATQSQRPLRAMAIALCVSFLLSIFLAIVSGQTILNNLGYGWLGSYSSDWYRFGTWTRGMALLGLCSGLIAVAACIRFALQRSTAVHHIAHRLSAWRFAAGAASDLIHVAPPMQLWQLRPGVCYLNHGSFGAVPAIVRDARRRMLRQLESEPMDALARNYESQWRKARFQLATWLVVKEENLALCENATAAMNEIAGWFPLADGDEVLINDHEYGAVKRIWHRRCERSGALLTTVALPTEFHEPRQIVDAILDSCNERTKLVIVSHITSPTAVRMPVETVCAELKSRGIASCIDGPHAMLQEPLRLYGIGCDFYTGSCHKWLCAPLGSGFVYVDPKWRDLVEPLRLSWGRLQPNRPQSWDDELLWTGTRDNTPLLAIPVAIRFWERFNWEQLDRRNHELARYARRRLLELPGAMPITPDGREWFGWMVAVALPEGDHSTLQGRLWDNYRIEIPIVHFAGRDLVRVSCHLYVTSHDIDFLIHALRRELHSS